MAVEGLGTGNGGSGAPAAAPTVPRVPVAGGHHLLVDFWVDDAEPLRRVGTWERLLPDACRAAGATVLGARFHQFQPDGVTGIVLLAESHASVHTWPEAGLVTLDVFTCGALDAHAIVAAVRQALAPTRERVTAVARGDVAQPEGADLRTAAEVLATSPLPPGEGQGEGQSPSETRLSTRPPPLSPPVQEGDASADFAPAPPRPGPEVDGLGPQSPVPNP